MTRYRQGDIVLVPFPFTDQSAVKQRPAVVMSSEEYNLRYRDLILAPITSVVSSSPDETTLADWEIAGLLKPSSVKPILSAFDTSLLRRQLGKLSAGDLVQVRQLFARVLNLPSQ